MVLSNIYRSAVLSMLTTGLTLYPLSLSPDFFQKIIRIWVSQKILVWTRPAIGLEI
jgi:hypothetical protein